MLQLQSPSRHFRTPRSFDIIQAGAANAGIMGLGFLGFGPCLGYHGLMRSPATTATQQGMFASRAHSQVRRRLLCSLVPLARLPDRLGLCHDPGLAPQSFRILREASPAPRTLTGLRSVYLGRKPKAYDPETCLLPLITTHLPASREPNPFLRTVTGDTFPNHNTYS